MMKSLLVAATLFSISGARAGSLSPNHSFVDFGVVVPEESKVQSIVLTNSGEHELTVNSIFYPNSEQFSLSHSCGTLQAQETCSINLIYGPEFAGIHVNDLIIRYSHGSAGNDSHVLTIGVVGRSAYPPVGIGALSIQPNYYNYGTISMGDSESKVFILTNHSAESIYLGQMLSHGDSFGFISSTCPLRVNPLAPSSSCTVSVRYSPVELGTHGGMVEIQYGVSPGNSARFMAPIDLVGHAQ